jgi:hypothetical protein
VVQLPFRRNNSDSENLPTEIKEYYQTERRERVGVAWLLALGTLVLTLILASGLFFGGRWAYRKIAGNDKPAETIQTEGSGTDQASTQGTNDVNDDGPTGTSSTSTDTASNSGTAPATTTTTPGPAPAPAALPNTGPSEE